MNNSKMNKKGFTLAELLAVVIILAIMAAISVGYYKRSVEQSYFSEGLTAASAIAEGVNREYVRSRLDGTTIKQPKLKSLDISIAKSGSCATASDYCIKTKYFEIAVDSTGVTKAYRGTTSKYKYYIEVLPHFSSSNKDRIACIASHSSGVNFNAKEFCQGLGYTSCSSNTCIKP